MEKIIVTISGCTEEAMARLAGTMVAQIRIAGVMANIVDEIPVAGFVPLYTALAGCEVEIRIERGRDPVGDASLEDIAAAMAPPMMQDGAGNLVWSENGVIYGATDDQIAEEHKRRFGTYVTLNTVPDNVVAEEFKRRFPATEPTRNAALDWLRKKIDNPTCFALVLNRKGLAAGWPKGFGEIYQEAKVVVDISSGFRILKSGDQEPVESLRADWADNLRATAAQIVGVDRPFSARVDDAIAAVLQERATQAPQPEALSDDDWTTVQELINALSMPEVGDRVSAFMFARGIEDFQAAIDSLIEKAF